MSWATVWVIGASYGIGKAFAELCASRGMRVVASARTREPLEDMSAASGQIEPLPFDVTDLTDVRRAAATLTERDLVPDLVLYNAGFYEPVDTWRVDADLFRRHIEVNYMGAVHVLSEVLPPLVDRGSGHVALVASLSGYCGLPKAQAYGPSKSALISLAESLKPQTDAAGIDLSVVNPGFVATRLTDKNDFSMPYLMSPEDAARKMFEGLAAKKFEVAFPRPFVRRLKMLRLLPYRAYFKVMKRLVS